MYILGSTGIVGIPVTSDVADVTWEAVSRVDDLLFAAATDVGRIPLAVAREEVEQLVRAAVAAAGSTADAADVGAGLRLPGTVLDVVLPF